MNKIFFIVFALAFAYGLKSGHDRHAIPPEPLLVANPASPVQGRFELTDAKSGKTLTSDSFNGRHRLVFFGFTHCRLICPMGLQTMRMVADELGSEAEKLASIFITTEPARDTAEVMARYTALFSDDIVGLVGDPRMIRKAMRSFRIDAYKMEIESEDTYQMDHPALVFFMDPQGHYLKSFPSSGDPEQIADEIARYLKG